MIHSDALAAAEEDANNRMTVNCSLLSNDSLYRSIVVLHSLPFSMLLLLDGLHAFLLFMACR